jgi:hypothetical protein
MNKKYNPPWPESRKNALRYLRQDLKKPLSECAAALGVTESQAKSMANALGIRIREQNYEQREDQWIECEDQFLRDNWGKMSIADMEHRLGRSVGAIMNRRRRLGMPTKNKAKAASKEAV